MEPVVPIVVAVLFLAALARGRQRASETQELSRIARELNTAYIPPTWLERPHLIGEIDGFRCTINGYIRGSGKNSSRWTRVSLQGVRTTISVKPQGALVTLIQAAVGQDVLVGDAEFDRRAKLAGDRAELLASLTDEVRGELLLLLERGVAIEDGSITWNFRGRVKDDQALVMLRRMAHLARAMRWHDSMLADRLRHNLRSLSASGFRLASLEELLNRWPQRVQKEDWEEVLRDPLMDLEAAHLAGPEILPILAERLAQAELRERSFLQLCVVAAGGPGAGRSGAVALMKAQPDLLDLAVTTLDQCGSSQQVPVVQALGWAAQPSARLDALLVRRLHSEVEALKRAAIEALGRQGTVAAVEALLPLTRGVLRGELGQAAEDAIRAIQARIGHAGQGQLSMAEVDGGLAVVPADGGLELAEMGRK